MAEPKNPNLPSFADAETLDIQRKMTEALEDQKDALQDMFGISKKLNFTFLDRLARQKELAEGTRNVERTLQKQRLITATTTGQERAASKLKEKALQERLTAYSKELQMLKAVNAQAIAPILYFLERTYQLFLSMDSAAAKFRMQMGFIRTTAKEFQQIAQRIAIDFMDIGVTIEGAYSSILAFGKEIGSINAISSELVKTTAILKAQLGVSEEATAGFLRNMSSIAGTTMETQKQMAYVAANLSNAAGVPFPQIMADIASKSERTLTMMSRIPSQVIRAAVELRKMGTDLNKAAESSRKLLDFTDNVNAEMEASVLLGHSINLQRARELAYRRDIEGSTKEILRLTKSIDFSNLDVFQQEAFARATGKSVDELMNMIQAEKQWDAARKSGDATMQARVAAYDRLRASNAAIQKDQAKQLEMTVLQAANQERIAAISQKWNAIMAKAGELLLPIIDGLLSIVPPIMEAAGAFYPLFKMLMMIPSVAAKIGPLFAGFGKLFAGVETFLPLLGRFGALLNLSKAIPGLGEAVLIIQGIYFSVKRIFSIFDDLKKGNFLKALFKGLTIGPYLVWKILVEPIGNLLGSLGKWILKGIFGEQSAIYQAIVSPFKKIWDWLSNTFFGNSPSQLALNILKGVVAVQTMLFDAITYPWRHAFAWILNKIPGMGKFADKLKGGAGGLVGGVEAKVTAPKVENTITPTPTQIATAAQPTPQTAVESQQTQATGQKTLDDILVAINMLNKNLMEGKIGFYVDGQLLSATIARQTEFRGGYGVNKV